VKQVEGKLMNGKQKQYNGQFKFKVALEMAKGTPRVPETISELASETGVHPTQIGQWKRQLLEEGAELFTQASNREAQTAEEEQAELYEQIGCLKMELESPRGFPKKKLSTSVEAQRSLIERAHPDLSIRRQCVPRGRPVGLNRSTLYYEQAQESALNLELMRLMDEQYLKTPFYGWPRILAYFQRLGHHVNHKRVRRLLQKMGLQAIYPKPKTSVSSPAHKIYPYLLRGLEITHVNQVWSADITYIPMPKGFMYLVAVMDWYSRYVLAWQLSNTLESSFCLDALPQALLWGSNNPRRNGYVVIPHLSV
jgi:putative transposase